MHKSGMLENARVTKEMDDSEENSGLNFDALPITISNPGRVHS